MAYPDYKAEGVKCHNHTLSLLVIIINERVLNVIIIRHNVIMACHDYKSGGVKRHNHYVITSSWLIMIKKQRILNIIIITS